MSRRPAPTPTLARTLPGLALLAVSLAGCGGAADRLSQVGQAPALSAIENPTAQAGYRPVQMPMPVVQPVSYAPASLWQSGSRTFLKGVLGRGITSVLPGGTSADALIANKGASASSGTGTVNRSEDVTTDVAAVVTQQLPNGNLVIEGRQEVRINFEVREMIVAGVVRPEDIGSDNTIDSAKIAEARISYGGRGQITDVQQPRYGQQVLDVLLPF